MICACFFAIPISLKTEGEKRKGQTGSWRQEKDDDGRADDDERAELEKKSLVEENSNEFRMVSNA